MSSMFGPWSSRFILVLASSGATALVASPASVDAAVSHGSQLAVKKSVAPPSEVPALLATLVQTHTDERLPLDIANPSQVRFEALLSDQVTGESHPIDPRLLELLRVLATRYGADGPPRIELVSGYRSAKRNEMMRKKGHHVASHSQHSLGHACDFRILPVGAVKAIDPREVEKEVRSTGWDGGVGVYVGAGDWFVHVDVGHHRRWDG